MQGTFSSMLCNSVVEQYGESILSPYCYDVVEGPQRFEIVVKSHTHIFYSDVGHDVYGVTFIFPDKYRYAEAAPYEGNRAGDTAVAFHPFALMSNFEVPEDGVRVVSLRGLPNPEDDYEEGDYLEGHTVPHGTTLTVMRMSWV